MRDLLLAALLLYACASALRTPWIGIIAWTVVSIMNPHKLSWVLGQMPVAAMVGGATLVGIIFSKDRKPYPWGPENLILVMMMLWFTLTSRLAPIPDDTLELWKKVIKIDFMILVAIWVLYSRRHIMALAAALAFSIGFYGFKGGIFTIATGGSFRVWGPEGSYIEGNNEIALALVVTIPMLRFLQLHVANRWLKHLLTATQLLSAVAAIGTQSRGALLALAAMAVMLWWRGKKKFMSGIGMLLVGISLIAFMPAEWGERMNTINNYEEDGSAMGRINAWWMAWNLARDHFFGGGFDATTVENFLRYAPVAHDLHAAHSIYFQILGEHGFVGLGLFLMLWLFTWVSAGRLHKLGTANPETGWLSDLGGMCQVSLVGYAVGGAFLSLAYFDLPYNIMVLVVLGKAWYDREARAVDFASTTSLVTRSGAAPIERLSTHHG
jgi:probable O-glycosylation ligase (exosortase A-associated)